MLIIYVSYLPVLSLHVILLHNVLNEKLFTAQMINWPFP